jgi:three-Cys-motif partner protein
MKKPFRGSRSTASKLDYIRQYLQQYSIALSEQRFVRVYIDAFAGTGSKTETRPALPLFDGSDAETQEIDTPGSARIALNIEPGFDLVALIERDDDRFAELTSLKASFSGRNIVLRHGDANTYVQQICKTPKWHRPEGSNRGIRGVIFLDPFGMEVEWSTVEAIAKTEALDCWYFFPLSGLYRNAPHDATKLDPGKERSLDRVLGTDEWRDRWYSKAVVERSLFETEQEASRRASVDALETYAHERLRSVFKGTVLGPRRLLHDNHAPMASLFLAVSNPSRAAVDLATRIGGHILRRGSSSHVRSR